MGAPGAGGGAGIEGTPIVYHPGGTGGGYIILIANEIEIKNTSTISANGGNGDGSSYSGGGGAGGIINLTYSDSLINNGTQTVTGGTGYESGSDGIIIINHI